MMPMTTTHRTNISDNFHDHALRAGLTHVDGWGSRSVFVGTPEQWAALRSELVAEDADLTQRITAHHTETVGQRKRKAEKVAHRSSVRACLRRIAGCV